MTSLFTTFVKIPARNAPAGYQPSSHNYLFPITTKIYK